MTLENRHGERIAIMEQSVSDLKVKVDKLEGNNESLVRLTTLMEVQTEINKKTNEQIDRIGAVLERVDNNLSNLNSKYDQMESNIEVMGDEMKSIKKAQAEESEKSKIHVPALGVKLITGIVLLLVTIAGAFLLNALGLK